MKTTISVLLASMAMLVADLAFASAVVTTATGSVQVVRGAAAARVLRLGDELNQGDTVFTGPNSSLIMKFDDGQVAAITSSSRMTISTYQYNPQQRTGNVLLSLINGGMRAITGLIGKSNPQRVSYRAATATIGIRGTDVILVTALGNVVVTVKNGEISFTFNGRTVTVTAGKGVNARTDGTFQEAAAQDILRQIPPELAAAIGELEGLEDAIQQASPGEPRDGRGGGNAGSGPPVIVPGGPIGGAGGGTASGS